MTNIFRRLAPLAVGDGRRLTGSLICDRLLQLGSRDQIFLVNFYIMGYNLKNARKGKSASKIPKWQSLSPLE